MEEYLIIMRLDLLTKSVQPSPEQMKVYMAHYREWVNGIMEKKKFVGGTGLSIEGKVLKPKGVITDGPYAELKESVAGFITVKAVDFNDATNIASQCPILNGDGNSVEVRKIVSVSDKY